MKIGILTFHYAINYGAILQCYALKSYLTELGHKVKVINYVPNNFKLSPFYRGNNFKNDPIKALKKSWLKYKYSKSLNSKFNHFVNNELDLTDRYDLSNISEVEDQFDAIIVGSDQVWNKAQSNDGAYFLSQIQKKNTKKISYAASCGFNYSNLYSSNKIKSSLLEFDSISVRDITTQQFVQNLSGIKPILVVDPVLLYDFKELDNMEIIIEEPYILTYILGSQINGGNEKAIKLLKKSLCMPVYSIMLTSTHPKIINWADKSFFDISIPEWLRIIKSASFIYTDSFHGVMFSIKYNKPFIGYYRDKTRSPRMLDLIERYDLGKCLVNSINDVHSRGDVLDLVDYDSLNSMLNIDISASKNYLKKIMY